MKAKWITLLREKNYNGKTDNNGNDDDDDDDNVIHWQSTINRKKSLES